MSEAWIIDAVRTPRGVGKIGKGALAEIHPQQVGSTVLRALAERNKIDTAQVDDVIWGTSSQVGLQGRDLGRMSALDAGYDVRSSGVTLDRFCGSGITTVNFAAATIMSGMSDLVVAGGTELMSGKGRPPPTPGSSPVFDNGNMRLRASHPQTQQGICADTIATIEGIDREAVDKLAVESQQRAAVAISEGRFAKSLVPVYHEDGTLALDREEYPRPQTTIEGLAALKPAFEAMADIAVDDTGATFRSLILQKYPDVDIKFIHHAGNSSGVVDGSAAVLLASPDYAKSHGLKPRARVVAMANQGDCPTLMLNAPGPAIRKVLAKAGLDDRRHRPLRDQRGVRRRGGEGGPRPRARSRQGQRQRRRHRARPPHRRDRLDADRHHGRRARAARRQARPRHHVRRRRHGAGDHRREDGLSTPLARGGAMAGPALRAPKRRGR